MSNQEPTVFILDNDVPLIKHLETLMRSVQLRAETHLSADSFFSQYDPGRAGCLILGVRLPKVSGLEVHRQLRQEGGDLPVIFLTGHADVPTAVTAMRDGAFDFLEKPANDQYLLDRVQTAIAQCLERRRQQAEQRALGGRLKLLSPRECDIIDFLIAGKTSKAMARELSVGIKTIDFHRANIMRKIGAETVAELVYLLLQGGYVGRNHLRRSSRTARVAL